MTQQKTFEIIYGVHPLLELLRAGKRKIYTLYTTKPEPKLFKQIKERLPKGVQIQYVERKKLDFLADSSEHQGFVAAASPLAIKKTFFTPATHPFLVLLDGIQDVRNLGAILRTAYCVGVHGVVLLGKSSAPLNAAAIKASAGLAQHLDIYLAASQAHALELLNKAGYTLYVTIPERGTNALQVVYTKPLCLVIGSEGAGVSPVFIKQGTPIFLPQKDPEVSYNASVAAGILLFHISHQHSLI